MHTIILKNDGSVWTTGGGNGTDGYYNYGQLGLGDKNVRTAFTQVTANINNDVNQVACSEHHTFIMKNDGSLWACGSNGSGQLGLNDTTNRNTFTQTCKQFFINL